MKLINSLLFSEHDINYLEIEHRLNLKKALKLIKKEIKIKMSSKTKTMIIK